MVKWRPATSVITPLPSVTGSFSTRSDDAPLARSSRLVSAVKPATPATLPTVRWPLVVRTWAVPTSPASVPMVLLLPVARSWLPVPSSSSRVALRTWLAFWVTLLPLPWADSTRLPVAAVSVWLAPRASAPSVTDSSSARSVAAPEVRLPVVDRPPLPPCSTRSASSVALPRCMAAPVKSMAATVVAPVWSVRPKWSWSKPLDCWITVPISAAVSARPPVLPPRVTARLVSEAPTSSWPVAAPCRAVSLASTRPPPSALVPRASRVSDSVAAVPRSASAPKRMPMPWLVASRPWLLTVIARPARSPTTRLPAALAVLSVLFSTLSVRVPVPVSTEVPGAMTICETQVLQSASTTPPASVWLAMAVKLPLSVVIGAYMRTERPASSVRSPPWPLAEVVTALSTVMSLLACSVTSVPALSRPVSVAGVMTTSVPVLLAKPSRPVVVSPPTPVKPAALPAIRLLSQLALPPVLTRSAVVGEAVSSATTVITVAWVALLPEVVFGATQTSGRYCTCSAAVTALGSRV